MTPYSDKEVSFILQNYSKMGALRCADILGRTPKQIRRKAQKMGVKLDFSTRSEIIKCWKRNVVRSNESYSVNPNLFRIVESPDVAYLLGFLWADGYIYRNHRRNIVGIGMEASDFDCYIKPILKRTGRWAVGYYQQKNRKFQARARISNKPLCQYLEDHGYRSKINSACSILLTIPTHLKRYWFRGLIDGDGCIYHSKNSSRVSIHSEYDQKWDYMDKICSELNVKGYITRERSKTGNKSQFKITSKPYILTFLNWVYEGYPEDNVGFKRKYDKYVQIKQSYIPSSSKYKGLSKTPSNTWQVRKWIDGKNIYLGTFKTENEAKIKYESVNV